jgi:3-dehydro-L-gulonate 2-dehydrogenase
LQKSTSENETTKIRYPGKNVVQTRNTNLKNGIPVNRDIWEKIMSL